MIPIMGIIIKIGKKSRSGPVRDWNLVSAILCLIITLTCFHRHHQTTPQEPPPTPVAKKMAGVEALYTLPNGDSAFYRMPRSIRRIVFYSLIKTTVTDRDIEKVPISVSQALQIAGRAGRYGTQYEEGLVTTFKEQDLDTLKFLLSQKPEPVSSAGILPTVDQIELYSYYLPHSSLCELIDIFINLSTVDDSLYFMCDLKDFKYLAQMIDHLLLPLRIKYVFCCAPVNKRNNFTCVMFVKFAKMYSENKPVLFKWICKQIDWPARKPKNLRHLEQLETLHEILDVYLWLSNRFEEYFPDGAVIRKIQIEIEMLINEGVINITKLMSTDESETVLNPTGSMGSTDIAKKLRDKEFEFTDWKKLARRRRRTEYSENDVPYSREKFAVNEKDWKNSN